MHDCKETYNGVPCVWHDPQVPVSHNGKVQGERGEMLLTWTYVVDAKRARIVEDALEEAFGMVKS